MKNMRTLQKRIAYQLQQGSLDAEVTGITCDSRKVQPQNVFVCIRGNRMDGHVYAEEAVERGAAVLVAERELEGIPEKVTVLVVKDSREALAQLSCAWEDDPAQHLVTIGVTGTKGKTTTAYMIYEILRKAGIRAGLIGTIETRIGEKSIPSENTTPEPVVLQKLFSEMMREGCTHVVMEVSSQGIALQRTADVFFDIGVFLNIEPDHIGKGEHATFSEYLYCKSRLMRQCGIGIVNQDDPNVDKILAGHTCEVETFSIRHPSDVMAEDEWYGMESGSLQSHFTVKREWRREEIVMQLPGQFNIYNALAAISVAGHFKVDREQIKAALAKQIVPGRCQNMTAGAGYVFLIDYAHNEMSLRNLLETLRKFEPERLIVIFGCGGNRSVLRRYQMGETAGRLADFTIITSDNPRWEDPGRIMNQIEDGLRGTVRAGVKPSYIKIADRRAAVEYAVSMAEKRDIIVLAGKGHESYQEIKGIRYPLDDRKIVQEALDGGVREYHC